MLKQPLPPPPVFQGGLKGANYVVHHVDLVNNNSNKVWLLWWCFPPCIYSPRDTGCDSSFCLFRKSNIERSSATPSAINTKKNLTGALLEQSNKTKDRATIVAVNLGRRPRVGLTVYMCSNKPFHPPLYLRAA